MADIRDRGLILPNQSELDNSYKVPIIEPFISSSALYFSAEVSFSSKTFLFWRLFPLTQCNNNECAAPIEEDEECVRSNEANLFRSIYFLTHARIVHKLVLLSVPFFLPAIHKNPPKCTNIYI